MRTTRTTAISLLLFFLSVGVCSAQQQTVSPHGLSFTLDPARTSPGTIEFEVGTLFGGSFDLPWVFKFTADSKNPLLRDFEWAVTGGVRGGSFNLILRRPVYSSDRFNLAVSPRVAIPTDGSRLLPGLALLISFPYGLNGFTVNGEVNQSSGTLRKAISGDYARTFGKEGWRSRVAVFVGVQLESSATTTVSSGQGFTYRVRSSFEIQAAVRQLNLTGERQIVVLTDFVFNLGRVQR